MPINFVPATMDFKRRTLSDRLLDKNTMHTFILNRVLLQFTPAIHVLNLTDILI
jgi:hypothetical protein